MIQNTSKQSFLLASWYTDDFAYTRIMETHIKPSFDSLGVDYTIVKLPSQGDWRANTDLKPKVVKQLLSVAKQDTVLIDCDARLLAYPTLFDNLPLEFDMAVHYLDRAKWYQLGNAHKELCSGTLFFRNRPICHEIVDKWQEEVKVARVVEQTVLEQIIAKNRKVKVYNLPVEYCWIHDLPDGSKPKVQPNGPIIVEHFQASRQNRKGR